MKLRTRALLQKFVPKNHLSLLYAPPAIFRAHVVSPNPWLQVLSPHLLVLLHLDSWECFLEPEHRVIQDTYLHPLPKRCSKNQRLVHTFMSLLPTLSRASLEQKQQSVGPSPIRASHCCHLICLALKTLLRTLERICCRIQGHGAIPDASLARHKTAHTIIDHRA